LAKTASRPGQSDSSLGGPAENGGGSTLEAGEGYLFVRIIRVPRGGGGKGHPTPPAEEGEKYPPDRGSNEGAGRPCLLGIPP